jgi:hypothetical protein
MLDPIPTQVTNHSKARTDGVSSSDLLGSLDDGSRTVSARVPARRSCRRFALVRRLATGRPYHSGSLLSAP